MGWLVAGVWIGAVVVAAVVLAFCLYEVSWKGRRLADDLTRLTGLAAELAPVQAELRRTQSRLAELAAAREGER